MLKPQQYDSDEDDLAVFDAARRPSATTGPLYGAPDSPHARGSRAAAGSRTGDHYASNPDPFANSQGVYDPYNGQDENTAAYGGGQAANQFGTAVDVKRYDAEPYDPFL